MRVLHGIWEYGGLCLWAEDSGLPRIQDPGAEPAPHPFALPAAELADLLEPVTDLARKADGDQAVLLLPTRDGLPLASPELAEVSSARRGKPGLITWLLPVLILTPAAAVSVLTVLDDVAADDPGFVLGASIPYLAATARFAASLAERGRLLPVLVSGQDGYTARWHPVLAGADAQRAHDLAAAMPPVCRAASVDDPAELLGQILTALADAATRSRLPSSLLPARRGRTPARIPISERYVVALTSTDARVQVETARDEAEAADLAAELAGWLDSARMPAGPVRTCFRLTEPGAAPEDPWRVEFTLQSTDDPSLMLPAAEVWAGAAGLGPAGGDPVEQLLAGLGGAARLFPELAGALREAAPCELPLDTAGAFGFLKQTGPLLAGAGFGVLLPDWVRKARLGIKLTTRSTSRTGNPAAAAANGSFGMQDLVDFRYDLAVGDQSLDAGELAELARRKIPLVRLRGQWVELDEAHLSAALRFLERNPPGSMSAADALTAGPRPGPARRCTRGHGGRGRVARRPAVRPGRPSPAAGADPARLHRHAAPLSGARAGLAVNPGRTGPRRHPGRRHGPGQDGAVALLGGGLAGRPDPAGLPDVAGRQLATRGGEVHP